MIHWYSLLGIVGMAQPGGGADQGPGGFLGSPFVLIAMIVAMFYFILYKPEKKRKADRQKMLSSLQRGDEVITAGGVYGKITAVNDNAMTLEIAPNVRIKVGLQYVSMLASQEKAEREAKDKDKDKEAGGKSKDKADKKGKEKEK